MSKALWEGKIGEWKALLGKPKNAGLKNTGASEAMRKVRDAEDGFDRAKGSMNEVTVAAADLSKELADLAALCKKLSDKHKSVFTEAAKFLDGVKEAAAARQHSMGQEVDHIREAVRHGCEETVKHLKAARDLAEFQHVWGQFALEFQRYGKAFPSLQAQVATVKEKAPPTDGSKATYIQLAEACQKAAMVR